MLGVMDFLPATCPKCGAKTEKVVASYNGRQIRQAMCDPCGWVMRLAPFAIVFEPVRRFSPQEE